MVALAKNRVCEIAYRCSLDRDTEEGCIVGYWTGHVDSWGKHTIRVIEIVTSNDFGGPLPGDTIYLFQREILSASEEV